MSVYLIQEETLAAIADKIREKSPQIWGQISEIDPQYFPVGIEDACTEGAVFGYEIAEQENTQMKKQLKQAKEILKDVIRVTWGEGWNYSLDVKVKAEQFLKENE